MKDISYQNCIALNEQDLLYIHGGGPIKEAVKWYYLTIGSFYRGIYDGLTGKEPVA